MSLASGSMATFMVNACLVQNSETFLESSSPFCCSHTLTAYTTTLSLPFIESANFCRSGRPLRQGPHQVAQKSMMITLPLSDARSTDFPSSMVSTPSGATWPSLTVMPGAGSSAGGVNRSSNLETLVRLPASNAIGAVKAAVDGAHFTVKPMRTFAGKPSGVISMLKPVIRLVFGSHETTPSAAGPVTSTSCLPSRSRKPLTATPPLAPMANESVILDPTAG